jgi:hypothetical protein
MKKALFFLIAPFTLMTLSFIASEDAAAETCKSFPREGATACKEGNSYTIYNAFGGRMARGVCGQSASGGTIQIVGEVCAWHAQMCGRAAAQKLDGC